MGKKILGIASLLVAFLFSIVTLMQTPRTVDIILAALRTSSTIFTGTEIGYAIGTVLAFALFAALAVFLWILGIRLLRKPK